MCSHIFSSRQRRAISATGSTLAVEVVPTVATTASGLNPDSRSLHDRFAQDRCIHSKFLVARHPTHTFLAKAKRDGRFLSRAVGLIRSVNPKSRKIASGQTKFASGGRGFFARDRKRMHDPDRRGIVNHAIEIFWQTHPLAEPIDHQSFELGRRRAKCAMSSRSRSTARRSFR